MNKSGMHGLNILTTFLVLFQLIYYVVAENQPLDTEPRMIPQNYPSRCRKTYFGSEATRQSSRDNDFFIKISGKPTKYQPNEQYTITLRGKPGKKFQGFQLMVEPKDVQNDISMRPDVGSFQLSGDVVSKYSEECPNTIVNASKILKSEIQVMWRAPPAGTGCVVFRAIVQENKDSWYLDEGRLIQVLCEEEQENQDEQPDILSECCACEEAKYELAFQGMWSRHTHPKNFPDYEWTTHFSDLIGVSHTNGFRMWEYGLKASEGVQELAEKGATKRLESELKNHSDSIRTIIKTRGLWYPNTRGKTFAVFRVDRRNHLMSVLTKLAPSPDWIVGVSALELCLKNCSWAAERVMNLYPWDAGTDNGINYNASKSPSIPQDRIRRITSSTPNNPLSPFYDISGVPMKPVATLTVTRQRLYERQKSNSNGEDGCFDDDVTTPLYAYSNDGIDDRIECRVSDWTDFRPCSVSCGQGNKIRTRKYEDKLKASEAKCKVQLVERETCYQTCPGGNVSCRTTEWGEWSECSSTCGKGIQMRSRKYLDNNARKSCSVETMLKRPCDGIVPFCDEDEDDDDSGEDPICAVTQWSEWSPCSVTCGRGVTVRTRLYLDAEALNLCSEELNQKSQCKAEKEDCAISLIEAKQNCMMPKEIGPCRGYFPRWYYDVNRKGCQQFIYGGCRGNKNNFERYNECSRICERLDTVRQEDILPLPSPSPPFLPTPGLPNLPILGATYNQPTPESTDNQPAPPATYNIPIVGGAYNQPEPFAPIDCLVSEWSDWSPCSATCGPGRKERKRFIIRNSENGGEPCPTKVLQKRKCKDNLACNEQMANEEGYTMGDMDFREALYKPVTECRYSPWSEWTPCTQTCGREIQYRAKRVLNNANDGDSPCKPKIERHFCDLPHCPPNHNS